MAKLFVRSGDEGDDEMEPRRALPVPSLEVDEYLDEGSLPATAEEYMRMVSAEARRIPDVVRALSPPLQCHIVWSSMKPAGISRIHHPGEDGGISIWLCNGPHPSPRASCLAASNPSSSSSFPPVLSQVHKAADPATLKPATVRIEYDLDIPECDPGVLPYPEWEHAFLSCFEEQRISVAR